MDTTEISLVCPVGTCVTVISTTPGDEDLEGEAFVLAATAFLIRQAALYGCLPVTIRQHYTSEIAAIGEDEYFRGFRPELN